MYSSNGEISRTKATAEFALLQVRRHHAEGLSIDASIVLVLGEAPDEGSVARAIERWLETKRRECDAGDLSPTYLRELERWFSERGHVGAWWSDQPVTALALAAIREWSNWLNVRKTTPRKGSKERPRVLSSKTRWNVHAAFHTFAAWLAEEDSRVKLPRRWPWPKKDEPAVTVIGIETQDAILDAIPEARRGIFLAMAMLGIRPGEAVALDLADYRDGWISVSRARKGERVTAPIRGTKTGAPKRLPVPEELGDWIARHHTKESLLKGGPLFPNPGAYNRDRRWSAPAMRRVWGKACDEVGVKVGIYAGTKHAMATHLLSRGVQERHIQALLGHADVRSTRRYAKLADEGLVEAIGRPKRKAKADTE